MGAIVADYVDQYTIGNRLIMGDEAAATYANEAERAYVSEAARAERQKRLTKLAHNEKMRAIAEKQGAGMAKPGTSSGTSSGSGGSGTSSAAMVADMAKAAIAAPPAAQIDTTTIAIYAGLGLAALTLIATFLRR